MVDAGVTENSSTWKEVRLKESTKLCNNYLVVNTIDWLLAGTQTQLVGWLAHTLMVG